MFQHLIAAGFLGRITQMSLLHLLLWCGMAASSVGLIVLLRTSWATQRPLHKCAILSLAVHLLLACIAMTVRIVVGESGIGSGPPIRVRIVQESPVTAVSMTDLVVASAELTPPPLIETPAVEPEESLSDPTQEEIPPKPPTEAITPDQPIAESTDSEIIDASDDTLPLIDPSASSLAASLVGTEDAPSRVDDAENRPQDTADEDTPAVVDSARNNSTDLPLPTAATSVAVAGSTTAPYKLRADTDRLSLVESQGGSRETEAAVEAAVAWLAAVQSPDGRWDASRFGAGRELAVLGHDRHGAGRDADTGISGLAILAFLGAGHTHQSGSYDRTVGRGLDFLMRSQAADGNLYGNAEFYAQMYCHSMASFALAEALAMTGDRRLEPSARRAINFSLRAQHPSTGGWRYRIEDTGDTSQLGWQMMVLASAERSGIAVTPSTWTGIERFLRSVRRGQYGGLASYRPDGPPSTSMTAEAFYCHLLLSEVTKGVVDEHAAVESTTRILSSLPQRDLVNLYYWYYATLALHSRQG
ncbi:MAG: hypothetical protein L0Z07_00485, partial [Planctomycetes bacterium]|nr:hypothetical protein [Planctomycetota bacterium]